jgi:serine/threonine protein kinase/tetratricopeptide (TPR) repeat protein
MAEDRYVLKKQIGAGGMGEVWLATDTLLNRPVAVKFLQITDKPLYKDLFLSEARTLASLQHPNITMIYDAVFEEAENRFYIMMEYVEGKSLADLIQESPGPLPLQTILDITIGILRALKYAHSKGIVHRDVKPDNVVIQGGEVKLTDFGLATLVSILAKTEKQLLIGTPAYMPPEQIIGEGMDGRADLYALGVALFEMVTGGHRPFDYPDQREVLLAHVDEEPPSVKEFAPTTPVMLEQIIMKLLAKSPEERYPSADVVLDLLNAMQARQQFNQRYLQLLRPETKPLIGRAAELKTIEALWAKTWSSNIPNLLVISGETGIGKSKLIVEFLGNQVVDKGFIAIIGRCDELGAPYTPFAEIMATILERGLVKPTTIEGRMTHILDQIPSLAPLLNIEDTSAHLKEKPAGFSSGLWKTLSDRMPNNVADNPLKAQWQFFATIITILVELGPTVLFLDDAASLDESSLALTRFLIRQVQLPLLVIAECTSTSKPIAWLEALAPAEREMIHLSPLPTASIRDYLVNLLEGPVSEAVVTVVEKRSEGNPFQIEEITRQLLDSGDFYRSEEGEWRYTPPAAAANDLSQELVSPHLLNALTRRVEKISQNSRDLLVLAALLEPGPNFDFDIWLALLGGEPQRAAAKAALDEALERRLVRDVGHNHYTFRPADIAKALTVALPKARRRELHHQIAEILIEKKGDPVLIGYHYEQAGLATESAHYLETAGARAVAANAINQAVECYKRAVNLVETQASYVALGNLYRQQGAWADSIMALQRALELAKESQNPDHKARILNDLAFTYWLSDRYREAAQSASAVLKLKNISNIERATAQSHLGMISWLLGHLKEAEEWGQKAVELLQDSGDESRLAGAYNRLGLIYFAKGKFTEAQKVSQLSLELRRKLGDQWGEAYCLVSLGQVAVDQGNVEQALAYFNNARQLFKQIGSNDGIMVVSTEQSRTLLHQGKTSEALALINQALRLAEEIGKRSAYGLGDIYLLVAQANLALGEIERAQSAAQYALNLVEAAGNRKYIASGQAMLAQIYEAQGRPDKAEPMYQKALELFTQVGHSADLLRTQLKYALFLADQGDLQAAANLERETRLEAAKIGLHL